MLGLQDIIGMCDCTEEEIQAIAEHEHLPDAIATELAEYLVHSEDGVPKIRSILIDNMHHAEREGDQEQANKLKLVLKHFIATHPDYKAPN